MATVITDVGRDWVRDVAIGEASATIDTVAVGLGTISPASSDEELYNEIYSADDTNSNVSIEATSGTGSYRCVISITGGNEVPADSEITEFGVVTSDGVLLMREVRNPVTIESGDTKTFEIPMKFDI